jgi:hypothetical protein
MEEIVAAVELISPRTAERLARGEAMRHSAANGFDREEAEAQLDALLAGAITTELP